MALHGFDLPLVYPAYEAIFARVMKKLGLTEKEIEASFSGPAHLPWSRMGNTSGGPDRTPPEWLARSVRIQHAIMKRLRELGMDAVLQGFAGVVPAGLRRVAPQAKIVKTGWGWGGHQAWFVLPDDPLFTQIGTDFIREWEKEFGPGTYYLADSFNECGLPWKDEASIRRGLKACGVATYNTVLAGHPTHDVRRWIASARACAEGNEALANAYETNARRIITTWGPALDGYAARCWSGTVKDYYLARLRLVRAAREKGSNAKADVAAFQDKWIDGRLPIAPPAPGWTCEKLAEETLSLGRRFLSAKAKTP